MEIVSGELPGKVGYRMFRLYWKRWVALLAVILLLAAAGFGAKWYYDSHLFLDGEVYARDAALLDLRGTGITSEHYDTVHSQLPDCEILWDIPFQGAYHPQDTTELALTSLSEEDIPVLDYFTQLRRVDAKNCSDYAQLLALAQRRPEVEVAYTVTIDGHMYPWNAEELTVSHITAEELALLQWLPRVKAVDATACTDLDQITMLREALPECDITYQVPIAGESYPQDTTGLALLGADPEELARMLPYLPQVQTVDLTEPIGKAESLLALVEANPQIAFTWQKEVLGRTITSADTEVDFSGYPLTGTDVIRDSLACFPALEKVVLCNCGLDNETLAAFREEMRPEYKVVWSVRIGNLITRTDAIFFMPTKYEEVVSEYQTGPLKYCEDMICVDMGHMKISSCEWAAYMPHLKYLVIADCYVSDLTPLSELKELVFLEIFVTGVLDYSPLLGCTALEDLNVSYTYGDPTPLYQMTWLKRLWWAGCPYGESKFREALPNTEFMFTRISSTGLGWRQGQRYYEMREILGMHVMYG